MTKKTIKDMLLKFSGYILFVPKGSTTTHQTACGIDKNYNFLCWHDGIKVFYGHDHSITETKSGSGFRHDFAYHGPNIEAELVA